MDFFKLISQEITNLWSFFVHVTREFLEPTIGTLRTNHLWLWWDDCKGNNDDNDVKDYGDKDNNDS